LAELEAGLLLADLAGPFLDEGSDRRLECNGTGEVAFGFNSFALLQPEKSAIHVGLGMTWIDLDSPG